MSKIYQMLKEGGKLDVEISSFVAPANPALQWTSKEIKAGFLDKIAADDTNSSALRTIATNLGNKIFAIATNRAGKTGSAKFKNVLSIDVDATATIANLEGFTPADQQFPFPNLPPPVPPPATSKEPKDNFTPAIIPFYGGGIFDVLGYVISCLGPLKADVRQVAALQTAKESFLLPLLILYAKWCITIAAECGLAAQKPSCVEMAVRVTSWTTIYFALGASVAGFDGAKAILKTGIVQKRRELLLNRQFLTQADLSSPPARILTLLMDVGRATVQIPTTGSGTSDLKIWKQDVIDLWKKYKAAPINSPYSSTNAEKIPLESIKKWEAAGSLNFTGDASELSAFAEKWLNPDVYKTWDSGREFGNCGETYPMVMLKSLDQLQQKMPGDATIVYGGMAILTDKAKGVTMISFDNGIPKKPIAVVPSNPDAKFLGPESLFSPCANCRVLMRSTAVAGATSPLMFLTGTTTPFSVKFNNIVTNQWV